MPVNIELWGKGNGKIIVPGSEFKFSYDIKENVVSISFKNEESRDTTYKYNLSKEHLELKDLNQTNVNLKLTKVENKYN